jgi:hypothetical protein
MGHSSARFEVLMAARMMFFWVVTLCRLIHTYIRCRTGKCILGRTGWWRARSMTGLTVGCMPKWPLSIQNTFTCSFSSGFKTSSVWIFTERSAAFTVTVTDRTEVYDSTVYHIWNNITHFKVLFFQILHVLVETFPVFLSYLSCCIISCLE